MAASSSVMTMTERSRAPTCATFPASRYGRTGNRINADDPPVPVIAHDTRRPPTTVAGSRFADGIYFSVTVSVNAPPPLFNQVMVPFWNSLIQPPPVTLAPPPVWASSLVGKPSLPAGPPWAV